MGELAEGAGGPGVNLEVGGERVRFVGWEVGEAVEEWGKLVSDRGRTEGWDRGRRYLWKEPVR